MVERGDIRKMQKKLNLQTSDRIHAINITSEVQRAVTAMSATQGICTVYVPHTTAGITVNESADPSVIRDVLNSLNRIVPLNDNYSHTEGNSAAHIKSILVGTSAQIPVENGQLCLGTWQGIFFCEFDGPRRRRVSVSVDGKTP